VKRSVDSELVSCFVSTFECHAKQPPKSWCFVSPRFSCFNSGPTQRGSSELRPVDAVVIGPYSKASARVLANAALLCDFMGQLPLPIEANMEFIAFRACNLA